jgi:DNA primase
MLEAPIDTQEIAGQVSNEENGVRNEESTFNGQRSTVNVQRSKALYKYEHLVMQLLVRYGEQTMCEIADEEGNTVNVTVIEFLNSNLSQDGIELSDPLFREMFRQAVEHRFDTDFSAERYFINHPDSAISRMALELVSDRYQLSKYHFKNQTIITDDKRLEELAIEIATSYKYAIINEELKEVMRQLQDPAVAADQVKCAQTIQRYTELREIQAEFAKRLGERVVLTF